MIMLLDLWNKETLTQSFMELYNLSGIQMCNILKELYFNSNQNSVSVFCEKTGIKLDELDVANGIEFVGKIVSTTIDDFSCLKQVGLVPIDVLLENDSPISQHLKKYGIEIKPSSHKLVFNGKQFFIPRNGTDCKYCAYGDERCRFDDKKYKDMYCPYLKAISHLSTKLYSDNAEIELFLVASREEMLSYSRVKYYPEIFDTIETLMKKLFKKELKIGDEWKNQKQTSYIVALNVKYENMSYRNGYIRGTDGWDAINTYSNYEKYCNNVYDLTEDIPKCFWDNVWLIQTCLSVICSFGNSSDQICAGVKHNVTFPYNKLKIELI